MIAGLVAWMMAAGKLSKDFESRKSEITAKFSALDRHLQVPDFPNSQWKEGADELVNQQKKKVRDTWKLVYEDQAQYLKWPESLDQRFRDRVSKLKFGADIPLPDREFYMNKVREEFPKLLEIVGAERGGKRSAVDVASTNTAAMMQDKVIWSSDSQTRIEQSLHFDKPPSALQVWITQEDLWVYQVLLTIIKKMNADSYVPPVKEIVDLEIAKPAVERFTQGLAPEIIEKPKNAAATSSEGAAPRRLWNRLRRRTARRRLPTKDDT